MSRACEQLRCRHLRVCTKPINSQPFTVRPMLSVIDPATTGCLPYLHTNGLGAQGDDRRCAASQRDHLVLQTPAPLGCRVDIALQSIQQASHWAWRADGSEHSGWLRSGRQRTTRGGGGGGLPGLATPWTKRTAGSAQPPCLPDALESRAACSQSSAHDVCAWQAARCAQQVISCNMQPSQTTGCLQGGPAVLGAPP